MIELTDDLRERMVITHGAGKSFADYDRMLARLDVRLMERKAREQAA